MSESRPTPTGERDEREWYLRKEMPRTTQPHDNKQVTIMGPNTAGEPVVALARLTEAEQRIEEHKKQNADLLNALTGERRKSEQRIEELSGKLLITDNGLWQVEEALRPYGAGRMWARGRASEIRAALRSTEEREAERG